MAAGLKELSVKHCIVRKVTVMDNGGSQTTTQNSSPWDKQKPFLEYGFKEAKDLYQTGGPQYYNNSTIAPLSDPSQAAITGLTNRALNGSALTSGAQGLAQGTMSGDYLSAGNPYFDQMSKKVTDQFNDTVMPGIASQFSMAGRYGSGAHTDAVGQAAEGLSDSLGALAYQNYGDERNRQMQTMQLSNDLANQDYEDLNNLAGAGGALDTYNQSMINSDIDRWNFSQQQPANNLAQFMGLVNGGYGSSNTTTAPGNNNAMGNIIGAGMTAASLFA